MPGTHRKWVRVTGGIVDGFATFMTGELFDADRDETILVTQAVSGADEAVEPRVQGSRHDGGETPGSPPIWCSRCERASCSHGGTPRRP